ncbi:hypothetical protein Tco_0439802, partial [Tanacetum coccineum]
NWKPNYKGSYMKEEEATGQWRTEIRLTDPYGNIYLQGFTTKKTDWKLSKYHKLSDIMSPNWHKEHTIMRPGHQDPNSQENMKPWKKYCFYKFTMNFYYGKDVAEMQSLEWVIGNGYLLKDKNKAKTDKTEHENGKSVKSQSQSQQVKDEDKTKEILNGPTRTHLMGRGLTVPVLNGNRANDR